MPITWKSVVAPNFHSSNVAGLGATRGIGEALNKINIFKNIQQDRSDAYDTGVTEEQKAFDRVGDELTNANIRQQMGFDVTGEERAVAGEARSAEEARLGNLIKNFTIENQQGVLEDERATSAATRRAAGLRGDVNQNILDEAKRTQGDAADLQDYENRLTEEFNSWPKPETPEAKAAQQNIFAKRAKELAQQYKNPAALLSGHSDFINRITAPTDYDIAQTKAAALKEERKFKKSLAYIKAGSKKGKALDLTADALTINDIKGWDWEDDESSRARYVNSVGKFEGQGMSNTDLKALARKYRAADGTWDIDGFEADANALSVIARNKKFNKGNSSAPAKPTAANTFGSTLIDPNNVSPNLPPR